MLSIWRNWPRNPARWSSRPSEGCLDSAAWTVVGAVRTGRHGGGALPEDPELRADLTGCEYGYTATGEIQLEKKEDIEEARPRLTNLKPTVTITEAAIRQSTPASIESQIVSAMADPTAVFSCEAFDYNWCRHLDGAKCQFATLAFRSNGTELLKLRGLSIHYLEIHNAAFVELTDCRVAKLIALQRSPSYNFENTMVGTFQFVTPADALSWNGGYLGTFEFNRVANPFNGDISFRNVRLPVTRDLYGLQWLRDTRAALNERNNALAASLFHASEAALSRPDEPWANRWASRVYELGSNFGNSISRPVGWFLGALAAAFILALIVGTVGPGEASTGWHSALQGDDVPAKVLRAAIYAMQSIFNPLNLIVANTPTTDCEFAITSELPKLSKCRYPLVA